MDDKNTPETPAADARPGDAARPDAGVTTSTPAPAPKRGRSRGVLLAGGAVLAAGLLAGGGFAVGAAIADEWEDDDSTASVTEDRAVSTRDDDTRSDDDGADSRGVAAGDLTGLGTDSAADLLAMIDAATAAAEGEPVSIEFERDGGAEVTLEAADGAEADVRVGADGTATVVSTDAADGDDAAPVNVLDADSIAAIVDAALGRVDGRIVDIEADDDSTSPWDVTVLTPAGQFIDLDLDGGFAVVSVGSDGDD